MSSMYFGCHALFTKPGQSLAPMFGWWVLQRCDPDRIVLDFDPRSDKTVDTDVAAKVWMVCHVLRFSWPQALQQPSALENTGHWKNDDWRTVLGSAALGASIFGGVGPARLLSQGAGGP